MRVLNRILAGVLLGVGLPISLLAIIAIVNPKTAAAEKAEATIALVLLGVTPTAIGGYLAFNANRQRQQAADERLRNLFFQLLREGNGQITPIRFAMEAGLDGEAAKTYLQARATEFDAVFNVSEQGTVSYYFDLGKTTALPGQANAERYDVILERVSAKRKTETARTVQQITHWKTHRVKTALSQLPATPIVLQQSVDKATAEETRRQLEAIGARVVIILK
jgi:ribosomal protein L7/L12